MTLHSFQGAKRFLRTTQKKYLVIKKTDWENNFLDQKMKIIKTDKIRGKTKIKSNEIKSLFNIEKLRKIINATETIYFMSNN